MPKLPLQISEPPNPFLAVNKIGRFVIPLSFLIFRSLHRLTKPQSTTEG